MKKFNTSIFTLLTAFALILTAGYVDAQLVGKPDGNFLNFINTNAFGRQLAHEQVGGTFGSFAPNAQWIGIGQPAVGGLPLPLYGMRVQWNGNLGTFSLEDNGQLEVQWGGQGSTSDLDFNFVFDPFAGSAGERNVMRMTDIGRVGINNQNPVGKLDVRTSTTDNNQYNIYSFNTRTSNGTGGTYSRGYTYGAYNYSPNNNAVTNYGSFNYANSAGTCFGASGLTKMEEGVGYGLYGEALICEGTAYGVYGTASSLGINCNNTLYAGYFDGDVTITGSLTVTSDSRLKKNIETETGALASIMKLRPTTYEFDREKYSFMNLSEGLNHGFIAQEVEKVFPEMVAEAVQPMNKVSDNLREEVEGMVELDEGGNEVFKYKSVNYLMMVPVLTKAIQEQQVQLEDEKTRNDELEAELTAIKVQIAALQENSAKSGGIGSIGNTESNVLFQNTPNPFDENTEIRYSTVAGATSVSLNVYNLQGSEISRFNNLKPGEGSVNLSGTTLDAGMYFYTLLVDGQEVATKRMILTKN
jgi:hypothetical protein